jgi:diacylglycerol kinase family enzyme
MRRTLIVNPNASRVTDERIAEVEARLRPDETLRTERRGHATELARNAAGDEVWVFGGDGVVNEALNGIRDSVSLGVVPGGGANVVARALGARERRISVGRVNGRRFAFSAGIGVDSEVVRELETGHRARSGRRSSNLQYGRAVAGRLFHGSKSRLEVVGRGRAAAVFVANDAIYTYAGPLPLRFLRDARFELGLDFAAPARVSPLSSASLFARVLAGRGMAGASGVPAGHDLDRIEVRCDVPLPLQADGEDLGDVTEAVFEAERDAVTVFV